MCQHQYLGTGTLVKYYHPHSILSTFIYLPLVTFSSKKLDFLISVSNKTFFNSSLITEKPSGFCSCLIHQAQLFNKLGNYIFKLCLAMARITNRIYVSLLVLLSINTSATMSVMTTTTMAIMPPVPSPPPPNQPPPPTTSNCPFCPARETS